MIQLLSIKNFALIEALSIEFSSKLNIFTGETGAGKSIILGALGLLLGERGSNLIIRKGEDSCEVSGVFNIPANHPLNKFLLEHGLIDKKSGTELIISRTLSIEDSASTSVRSRCFINSKPVTLSVLEQIGDYLVDIHGQHEHQALLKTSVQRDILDNYGNLITLRSEVGQIYKQYQELKREQEQLLQSEQERAHKIDLFQFQKQEIESAKLNPEDEEELETEFNRLSNAEKLNELVAQICNAISDDEAAAVGRLQKSEKLLNNLVNIDSSVSETLQNLQNCLFSLEDVANTLRDYRSKIEFNPKKLEEISDRRDLIQKLKKKYGATIKEILDYKDKTSHELDNLLHFESAREEIKGKIDKLKTELNKKAEKLSEKRKDAADKLKKAVEKELKVLGMSKSHFAVALEILQDENNETIIDSSGRDKIEFLIAPNLGEDLRALAKIASGGEMSRIMLALKTVLAQEDDIPTLIFDEIDTGIGGSMADIVGRKLEQLASIHQVICITHLPQIACFAQSHFRIEKEESGKRTITTAVKLEKEDRLLEIARMLGGETDKKDKLSPTILQHAKELINKSK